MKTFFLSQDLWEVVESTYEEPPKESTSTWTEAQQKLYKENSKKDASALRYIEQGVSKTIYPRIFGADKAKKAWDILKNEFKGNDRVIFIKLQSLWRDFDNMAMKESENTQEFLSKVAETMNQIWSYGDTIKDRKIGQKVLHSLPQKFDHVVAAIEESKDLSSYTLHELMSSLQVHE